MCSVWINAHSLFALFALIALGTPRTGVLVALDSTGAQLDLSVLVGSVLIAGAVGFTLVLTVGDAYLRLVGRADYTRLSVAVLVVVVVLVAVLTGPLSVGVLAAASLVGLVPVAFGARRAPLMGVLLVPLALGV